jgi:hypothetical protein
VVSHLNLNGNPNLRQPYGASAMKTLCCGPCKSGPITAQFSVPKQGFVPGEAIRFRVEFNNASSRDIPKMEVSLVQNLMFHAQCHSKRDNRKVAGVLYPGQINANSTQLWDNGVIVIPPVCSSSNGICRIIQINYSLVLHFSVSGPSIGTSCLIPCVIGTIPLTNNGDLQQQSQSAADSQGFSYAPSAFEPTPGITNGGYEAADKGEMIQSDAATFKPMYPYYKDFSLSN